MRIIGRISAPPISLGRRTVGVLKGKKLTSKIKWKGDRGKNKGQLSTASVGGGGGGGDEAGLLQKLTMSRKKGMGGHTIQAYYYTKKFQGLRRGGKEIGRVSLLSVRFLCNTDLDLPRASKTGVIRSFKEKKRGRMKAIKGGGKETWVRASESRFSGFCTSASERLRKKEKAAG